jgi:hypothetical protein
MKCCVVLTGKYLRKFRNVVLTSIVCHFVLLHHRACWCRLDDPYNAINKRTGSGNRYLSDKLMSLC